MVDALSVVSLILVSLTFLSLYRAIIGPSPADRVVAINAIGAKAVAIIATVSFRGGAYQFLDVCLVYALLSFIATVGCARYLEFDRIRWRKEDGS